MDRAYVAGLENLAPPALAGSPSACSASARSPLTAFRCPIPPVRSSPLRCPAPRPSALPAPEIAPRPGALPSLPRPASEGPKWSRRLGPRARPIPFGRLPSALFLQRPRRVPRLPIAERHPRPRRPEQPHRLRANPPRPAGNQRRLTFQQQLHACHIQNPTNPANLCRAAAPLSLCPIHRSPRRTMSGPASGRSGFRKGQFQEGAGALTGCGKSLFVGTFSAQQFGLVKRHAWRR